MYNNNNNKTYNNVKYNNVKWIVRFLKEEKLYKQFKNILAQYNKNIVEELYKINKIQHIFNKIITMLNLINIEHNKLDKLKNNFEIIFYKTKYNKTKKQILDEFLKNYNIYEIYYKNLNQYHNNDYEDFINKKPIDILINNAFLWKNTNQGFEFWEKISKQYFIYTNKLSKLNNNI